MKIEVESSPELVTLPVGSRARLWRGKTGRGVPIVAVVALIGVDRALDAGELEAALTEVDGPDGLEARLRDRAELIGESRGLFERIEEIERAGGSLSPRQVQEFLLRFALYIQLVGAFCGEDGT
jgi:hypothetical protein